LRLVTYETENVWNAVGGDFVTVEVQVLQTGVVVKRCDDAFQTRIVQTGVA